MINYDGVKYYNPSGELKDADTKASTTEYGNVILTPPSASTTGFETVMPLIRTASGTRTYDLNTYRGTGVFILDYPSSSSINYPMEMELWGTNATGNAILEVFASYTNTYISQRLTKSSSGDIYIRGATSSGSWNAWYKLGHDTAVFQKSTLWTGSILFLHRGGSYINLGMSVSNFNFLELVVGFEWGTSITTNKHQVITITSRSGGVATNRNHSFVFGSSGGLPFPSMSSAELLLFPLGINISSDGLTITPFAHYNGSSNPSTGQAGAFRMQQYSGSPILDTTTGGNQPVLYMIRGGRFIYV